MSILTEQRAPQAVKNIRRYFPAVDRVADANKPITIEVTDGDCTDAKKKSENSCVMAKACERLPGIDGAIIKTTSSYLIRGTLAIRYKTPPCVVREIVSFDRHRDFRPGTYYLAAISKSHLLGVERAAGNGNGKKSKGVLKHRKHVLKPHGRTQGIRGVTPKD